MPIYNLIEYSDVYSKTSGSSWQYYGDEPALDINNNIIDFPPNHDNSILFRFKQQITGQTGNGDTKGVIKVVSLKYLRNLLVNTRNAIN